MVQRLVPGGGYVDETGARQALVPGVGYVEESGAAPGGPASGAAVWTEADDAASIAGNVVVPVAGSAGWSEANDAAAATGSVIGGDPSITLPTLKNNTGSLLANEAGAAAFVYNVATGALVLSKTGLTTDAAGVMVFADPALVSGTTYRVVLVLASGAEGMDKVTAA